VESAAPRLLITLRSDPNFREALARNLPGIPWAFADAPGPIDRSGVEAMLVGSLSREMGGFDPNTTPSLRFVQRMYTGLDGFPFDRFPPAVQVAGNVGAFAPFVAEHAIALALSAARELAVGREMVRAGRLRPAPEPRLLTGSTAVVLGFGEIGRQIAHRLHAFGAQVIGVNRTGAPDPEADRVLPGDRVIEALAEGDFVFEVRPLTRTTAGTIGRKELDAMRPNAILVNIGRAGTVDEEAIFRHLQGHPSFRAAFDVWWVEDYAAGTISLRFPFGELENFSGTPHGAGGAGNNPLITARALDLAMTNVSRFFAGVTPLHLADRREYAP
jgi:D-2-hydroxyacid dehydrogenase (NADP+)